MTTAQEVVRSRLDAVLRRLRSQGKTGLSIYLPFGYPDVKTSEVLLEAAADGGADWLEVGIPFSDPVADGPTLQAANAQALANGATVAGAFAAIRRLRGKRPGLPIVAMTYANIVHRRGWQAFARELASAGGDGLIVPDVPLEEFGPLAEALASHGLAYVPLVSPATQLDRMAAIARSGSGFLYVVANVGVTGQGDLGDVVETTLARARKAAPDLPLVVGFGVKSVSDIQRLRKAGADAVIVGSHIVALVSAGAGADVIRAEVAKLKSGC